MYEHLEKQKAVTTNKSKVNNTNKGSTKRQINKKSYRRKPKKKQKNNHNLDKYVCKLQQSLRENIVIMIHEYDTFFVVDKEI